MKWKLFLSARRNIKKLEYHFFLVFIMNYNIRRCVNTTVSASNSIRLCGRYEKYAGDVCRYTSNT